MINLILQVKIQKYTGIQYFGQGHIMDSRDLNSGSGDPELVLLGYQARSHSNQPSICMNPLKHHRQ